MRPGVKGYQHLAVNAMRLSTSLCCALLLVAPALHAQATPADRDLVKKAALDYVEGFYEGDTAKLTRSVSPDVHKFGYWRPRDATGYQGGRMTWPEFHAYANRVKASGRPTPATAPKEIVVYDVLDQTASAKLTASWGTDYLLLAKLNGRWMITHVLWQSAPRK
jgi:hypothetical protein